MLAFRPLDPGVVAVDGVAISTRSGAALAYSPHDWTEGCAVIHNFLPSHPTVDIVAYLDPVNGSALAVDVVRIGVPRAFQSRPDFWTTHRDRQATE